MTAAQIVRRLERIERDLREAEQAMRGTGEFTFFDRATIRQAADSVSAVRRSV